MQSPLPEKFGKFEVIREIGKGGFGVVYEGRDPILKRKVAIKTCSSEDDGLRLRFQREAEIVASLQHPNVTTVHDLGVEDGVPYLVQEYLSGKDLSQLILARKEISLERKIAILRGVASGLEQAHKRGIVHRDIKPGNIRLLDDGSVKVMDFGIAKLLADSETQLTQTGMMIGTAAYLAPEQVSDVELDHRCDIFSFGVVAYELLTFQRPFSGTTISALLYKINHDEHKPLGSVFPGAPPTVASLVDDCLSKDPDGRPLSFTDVLRRLDGGEAIERGATKESSAVGPSDTTRFAGARVAQPTQSSSDEQALAEGATMLTAQPYDPAAKTILETQVESGEVHGQGGNGRAVSESAISQMFSKASRPSVWAVGLLAAVAAVAIWFGVSRGSGTAKPEEPVTAGAGVASRRGGEASDQVSQTDPAGPANQGSSGGPTAADSAIDVQGVKRESAAEPRKPNTKPEVSSKPANRPPIGGTDTDRARRLTPSASDTRRRATPDTTGEARGSTGSRVEQPGTAGAPRTAQAPTTAQPPDESEARTAAADSSVAQDRTSQAPPSALPKRQAGTQEPAPKLQDSARAAKIEPAEPVAATAIDHEPALREVMNSYAEAIQAMDGSALKAIWPSLSSGQLRRIEKSFDNAQVMAVDISRCAFDFPSADATTATATCRVTRGITPKAGRRQSNTSTTTFRFRRNGDRWVLDGL